MSQNFRRDAVSACEIASSATVEVPGDLLRRAQVAACEYSDYGSNDAENDVLDELMDIIGTAIGDPGHATWRATIAVADGSDIIDAVAGMIPSVEDSLELDGATLTATVNDERLGVAQAAFGELLDVADNADVAAELIRIEMV